MFLLTTHCLPPISLYLPSQLQVLVALLAQHYISITYLHNVQGRPQVFVQVWRYERSSACVFRQPHINMQRLGI